MDFIEAGESELEKIVIGLYSLEDGKGGLLVHDWRAPVCSLYYDSMPGDVGYDSPSGRIVGQMTLKRQYRMENGQLKYYVDTQLSIDDGHAARSALWRDEPPHAPDRRDDSGRAERRHSL